jgi:hypothetical protein
MPSIADSRIWKGEKQSPMLARLADENDQEFFGHLPKDEQTGLVEIMMPLGETLLSVTWNAAGIVPSTNNRFPLPNVSE